MRIMLRSFGVSATLALAAALTLAVGGCEDEGGGEPDGGNVDVQVDATQTQCDYDGQCIGVVSLGTCQVARCVEGSCVAAPAPRYSECEVAGTQLGDCERGSCDDGGACQVISVEDGRPCSADDWTVCKRFICTEGLCVEEDRLDCDDKNPCTDDSCEPAADGCVFVPNTADCDDNNECTGGDKCTGGECVGDQDLCQCETDADCDAYDDGDLCNGTMECVDRLCVPKLGSAVVCDAEPSSDCVTVACKPETGQCVEVPSANYIPCDDGDPCTGCPPNEPDCNKFDFCQGGVCRPGQNDPCACSVKDDCAAFDSGDPCLPTFDCIDEKCAEDPATGVDCSLQQAPACNALYCDSADGTCKAEALEDGTTCDDGDPCTEGDSCVGGACEAGGTDLCACTEDTDCAGFDDGDLCNGVWTCQDERCALDATTVVDCSALGDQPCRQGMCIPETGQCVVAFDADETSCDDGNECTDGDKCMGGTCMAGETNVCECTTDCDCVAQDDGDYCNGAWVCVAGGCIFDTVYYDCSAAPGTPTVASPAAGGWTNDDTLDASGTGEPGDTISLMIADSAAATTEVDCDGVWSFADVPLTEGDNAVSFTAARAGGPSSPASAVVTLSLDTEAPGLPVITSPTNAEVLSSWTSVVGTAEPGSTVTVEIKNAGLGIDIFVQATADGAGDWSAAVDEGGLGANAIYSVSAKATDAAGNDSGSTTPILVAYQP